MWSICDVPYGVDKITLSIFLYRSLGSRFNILLTFLSPIDPFVGIINHRSAKKEIAAMTIIVSILFIYKTYKTTLKMQSLFNSLTWSAFFSIKSFEMFFCKIGMLQFGCIL